MGAKEQLIILKKGPSIFEGPFLCG